MKRKIQLAISFFVGLFLFTFVLEKIGWQKLLEAIFFLFSFKGISLLFLTFLVSFISAFKWKKLLKKEVSWKKLWPIWTIGFSISYLTVVSFLGGEGFRILFVKKRIETDWERASFSVVADKILDGTFFIFFAILAIWLFLISGAVFLNSFWLWGIVSLGLISSLLSLFYLFALRKKSILELILKFFGKKRKRFKKGAIIFSVEKKLLNFFSERDSTFWEVTGLTLIKYLLLTIRAGLLFFFLTEKFSFINTLVVYGFANVGTLLPFPATIGGMEGVQGLAFKGLGYSFSLGSLFGMIWREIDLFIVIIGILFLIKYSLKLFQENFLTKISNIFKNENENKQGN